MYLKLSVAGHLTIFATRTRDRFGRFGPRGSSSEPLIGTQLLATAIAVWDVLMAPLGLAWVAFVWVYALAWFLVNDRVKLLTYRVLDARRDAGKQQPRSRLPAASR